jgi:uncharacterized membrane protein (DUF4010 family)
MLLVGVVAIVPLARNARAAHARGGFTAENPFDLKSAVVFGLLFAGVLVVAQFVRATLGDAALVLAGLAAGVTDVDAITVSTATLAKEGLATSVAGATILAAVASNTAMKTGVAFATGGRALGLRMLRLNGAMLAAGAVVVAVQWLRS